MSFSDHVTSPSSRLVGVIVLVGALIGIGGWLMLGGDQSRKDEVTLDSENANVKKARSVLTPSGSVSAAAPVERTMHFTTMKATGIEFRHSSGDSTEHKPFPAANGSGLASFDYDLDGLQDLYFLTGCPFPLDDTRTKPQNACYRNLGDWKFADVSQQTGLDLHAFSAGVAVGDFDSDGFPDVFVSCFGRNHLFHNCGDGTFEKCDPSCGAGDEHWATSTTFLDFNNDGLLDLYVCNYAEWTFATNRFCGDRDRNIRIFCSPKLVKPVHDVLLLNCGDGSFKDVLHDVGCGAEPHRGQGVVAADLNDDGFIDLYVANDLHPNSLFLNTGAGRFTDASGSSGAAVSQSGGSQAGMGVDAADVNGDGLFELFVTNYEDEYNAFYDNTGGGLFDEISQVNGLATLSRQHVGWGTVFADLDADGFEDVIVTNGHTDNNLSRLGKEGLYDQPPLIWRRVGDRYESVTAPGEYFRETYPGRGLVVSDIDNDGDADVIVGHQDQPPGLLRNDAKRTSNIMQFRLIGTRLNRPAIGAVVSVKVSEHIQVRQVKGGGSYLSCRDSRLLFAVPGDAEFVTLTVRWGSGGTTINRLMNRDGSFAVVEAPGESKIYEHSSVATKP